MDIAFWTATVVVAWMTLSVLVGLIIGRVMKFRNQQVAAMGSGTVAGPALGERTVVRQSTVAR